MSHGTTTAIIAAASALSGVALSQAITLFREALNRKHQRRILLREKYEEMGLSFLISLKHYTELQEIKDPKQLFRYAQNFEANKCYLLCDLYFSVIRDNALSYVLAYVEVYKTFALASSALDGEKCLAEIAANTEAYRQNKLSYEKAKIALEKAISINAVNYTKS